MANGKKPYSGSLEANDVGSSQGTITQQQQRGSGGVALEQLDDVSSAMTTGYAAPRGVTGTTRRSATAFETQEVTGDTVITPTAGESADANAELGNPPAGFEAGGEYLEATPEQLAAAESGGETAVSDLRGIEGFEEFAEAGEEAGAPVQVPLLEAGEAANGAVVSAREEFLPVLAALAGPLISKIGPKIAGAVVSRLKPGTVRKAKKIAKAARPVVAGAAAGAVGALKGKPSAASGTSSLLAMITTLLEKAQQAPSQQAPSQQAPSQQAPSQQAPSQQAPATGVEFGLEGLEFGMEAVDEALVEEAVAVLEVIIGTDDRVRITATTGVPWRRVCALRIHFPSGGVYRGTAFLIGPRAAATAGHCVYMHNQGGWAKKIEVIPGCNGAQRPFGQVEATSFRSVSGWVHGKKPESDYGCIILPPGAFGAQNLGSFGFAAFDPQTLVAQPAVLGGYPGDKPFAELWAMSRKIKTVTTNTLHYDIDTVGGQSGAPVYIMRNQQRYVVGIHNYGASAGNSATRVTQAVYQRLKGWSQI